MENTSLKYADNREAQLAWDLITRTGSNVFLTGRAGTGKTTFLKSVVAESNLRVVVAAPTGIAAINAHGVTLHSLFQLSTSIYLPGYNVDSSRHKQFDRFSKTKLRLLRNMDLLVIDEVSMVRADLLDAVDASLRRHRDPSKPFGGVQLLLVGDLQQLPPVVNDSDRQLLSRYYDTPYFFSARALRETLLYTVELKKIYRQKESEFVEILNRVRDNNIDATTLESLNRRYIPRFDGESEDRPYIRLVTHNHQAHAINSEQLERLSGKPVTFEAEIRDDFNENAFPAERLLVLKVGARVMFLRNDTENRYCNGTLGTVASLNGTKVVVSTDDGVAVECEKTQWENIRYAVNEATGQIVEEVQGTFTQLPLRLAWAITVHKSQGLTFDRAIIDVADSFAAGQAYVALSRCRSLKGLVLARPITATSVLSDSTVNEYLHAQTKGAPELSSIACMEQEYMLRVIGDAFDIAAIQRDFNRLHRLASQYVFGTYESLNGRFTETEDAMRRLSNTSGRFLVQLKGLMVDHNLTSDEYVGERIKAAAAYFLQQTVPLSQLCKDMPTQIDNKQGSVKVNDALEQARRQLFILRHTWANIPTAGATMKGILSLKAQAINLFDGKRIVKDKSRRRDDGKLPQVTTGDVKHPKLLQRLCAWRSALSKQMQVPAFVVAATRDLIAVANNTPRDKPELKALPGWGSKKIEKHGTAVLDIVAQYLNTLEQS